MQTMRADPLSYLGDELDELRAKNLYRPLREMSAPQAVHTVDRRQARDQPVVEQLPGPDHPSTLVEAALSAVREFGVGTGAVRTIAGDTSCSRSSSGGWRIQACRGRADAPVRLTANSGTIPADHHRARSDRQRRAQSRVDHRRRSPVQGVASRLPASRRRRPREGAARARATGGPNGPYRAILVITDGVFSMDGDIAPLPGICEVADRYEAAVMVDDAHASRRAGQERPRHDRPFRPPRPRRHPGRARCRRQSASWAATSRAVSTSRTI